MERNYTITLKITRTYARIVNRADKLAEVRRAIARALPDGWTLDDAKISLRTTSAKSIQRAEAREKKAKAKRAKEREARAKEREAAKVRRAVEAVARKAAKQHARSTYIASGISREHREWMLGVLAAESMAGWKVHTSADPTARKCWWSQSLDMPGSMKKVLLLTTDVRVYLLGKRARSAVVAAGCALSILPRLRLAFLHEVAHYRRWHATRRRGLNAMAVERKHNRAWTTTLINLLKKHCPETFTVEAQAMESLRTLK